MQRPEFKQRGVVLLLLLLVFLVGGTSMMLGTFDNRQDIYQRQQAELSNQLQLAKEALLAFAANSSAIYDNTRGPGFFPCPDKDNDGTPDDNCDSGVVNLGRLPEHVDVDGNKIFLNSYYAGTNQQFWYAVAPRYIYSANPDHRKADNRTSNTYSRLSLDGAINVVALIIAPGEALSFQNRSAGPITASNFLEGDNAVAGSEIFTTAIGNPETFNDRIIAITHDELMMYIATGVALKIKQLLDDDYDSQTEPRRYPGNPEEFVALLVKPSWLQNDTSTNYEQWASNITYGVTLPTQASIYFRGCSLMSFNLEYGEEITRDHDSC